MLAGQRLHLRELFERGANAQGAGHLGLLHGLAYSWQIGRELGKGQVAMGVCEHGDWGV